jgi:ACS family glucarate transporter-like MFS transporter
VNRPTNVRWLIFALACGTSWLLYLHRYTFNFIKPELAKEFGYTEAQLGGLFSLFYYTYGGVQLPAGMFCDIAGSRVFLGVIIGLWSLALATTGVSGDYRMLAALRLLFGGAQAGAYPVLAKASRAWFPRSERTTLQGIVATTCGRLGGALSPIVMATVLMGACGLSWRMSLLILMVGGVIFAVIVVVFYRDNPSEDGRVNELERRLIASDEALVTTATKLLPFFAALKNRSLFALSVQQTLAAGADVIYVFLMGSFFLDNYHVKIGSAGLLASLPLIGGAIGGFAGGWLNDRMIGRWGPRWGRVSVGFCGPMIAAALMFVVIGQKTALAAGLGLMLVKFFVDWNQPTVWGAAADLGGRYTGTVFAIVNTAGTIGSVVCPPAFGFILDWSTTTRTVGGEAIKHIDYGPLFAAVAGIYLLSSLSWLAVDCRERLDRS